MGLVRFLFFLLIAGTIWFMVKNYARKQELRERRKAARNAERLAGARIVRCKACDVHLPEQDALREGDNWFCSQTHKHAWLANSQTKK